MKPAGWLLFIVMVIYFLFLIRQDIIDNLELKKEIVSAGKTVAAEKLTVVKTNDRLAHLKSDDMIEELARTKLGLVKKGETAYKVVR
jgi:cell division protein FtsB